VSKNELGKGIRALLGNNAEDTTTSETSGTAAIALDQIETNPFQPRKEFDEVALQELADSIKTFGLIQPITVRRLHASRYQLISGERRFRAAKSAGLSELPAFVRTANDQEMLEMALVENIQRHDLNAIEVAISYQRLIDECSLTHETMSERVGKKRSTVSNYLRLLKLPPVVQEAIMSRDLSMGHARALLSLDSDILQLNLLKRILEKGLSVRATEALVRDLSIDDSEEARERTKSVANPLIQNVEDHLSKYLSARVKLNRSKSGKGTMSISFSSDDDLNRILDVIEGN